MKEKKIIVTSSTNQKLFIHFEWLSRTSKRNGDKKEISRRNEKNETIQWKWTIKWLNVLYKRKKLTYYIFYRMHSNVSLYIFSITIDAVSVGGAIQCEISIEWLSTRKIPFDFDDAPYSDLPLNLFVSFHSRSLHSWECLTVYLYSCVI